MSVLRRWRSRSLGETRAIGAELGRELQPSGILLLEGDLGAGKTVLTKGVAEALGLDPDEIQSPTFIVAREHRTPAGRLVLVHIDLYRLESEDVAGAGLDEMLSEPCVKVVEWAERLGFRPKNARILRLEVKDDDRREIVEIDGRTSEKGRST